MKDLYGVMNLLDPDLWGDEEEFYDKYGGDEEPPAVEQIQALQVIFCRCCPFGLHCLLPSQKRSSPFGVQYFF